MTDDCAERFDDLVGGLDYPMYLVTATAGGERAGCLVGFGTQTSIHPPRYLVLISEQNHTWTVAVRATHLAVHIPTAANAELVTLFGSTSGSTTDKFARCAWHEGPAGVALLDDCPQWFCGRVLARLDGLGDHTGFLLEPVAAGPEHALGQFGFQQAQVLPAGHEA